MSSLPVHSFLGCCVDGHCVNSQWCVPFRFNKENIFAEDSLDMGFVVREPIINATFGDIRFRR